MTKVLAKTSLAKGKSAVHFVVEDHALCNKYPHDGAQSKGGTWEIREEVPDDVNYFCQKCLAAHGELEKLRLWE